MSHYNAAQVNRLLAGAVILRAEVKEVEEMEQFNLIVRLPDGQEAEVGISSDPEGNATGWLDLGHLERR
jgi:hypothetical protein